MRTRVLLVDDHEVVLRGIAAALEGHEDLEVVGMISDPRETLRSVEKIKPDVVILDLAMPHFNGVECTYQIKKLLPKTKIIIFSMHSYREFLLHLLKAGISAYVLKSSPVSDLYLAIQIVMRNGTFFSENAPEFLAQHIQEVLERRDQTDPFDLLSPRERQVFQMLAEGNSVKKTAGFLCISPKTVETHKYHIMEKLNLRSIAEWTKEAIRRGIVHV
ncbi:MAG: response regulator [Thermodesulfobacteriota bacterium]